VTFYFDSDNDGYGNPFVFITDCRVPNNYVSNNLDCDDTDSNINPGEPETCDSVDNNCSNTVDEGCGCPANEPCGTFPNCLPSNNCGSCGNPPQEICDGIDNDCDRSVDEGFAQITFYLDADGDSYGNSSVSQTSCTAPSNYVLDSTDCNDNDASINPGRPDTCDGIDNDCDPNTAESCGCPADKPCGVSPNCMPLNQCGSCGVVPTEICDGVDNDCDGLVDEGLTQSTYYRDADGDGFGNRFVIIIDCERPIGYVLNRADCNDNDRDINPDAPEICDGIDNNCDNLVDNGCGCPTDKPCGIFPNCVADNACGLCGPTPAEICGDNIDNDCDGRVDEDCFCSSISRIGITNINVIPVIGVCPDYNNGAVVKVDLPSSEYEYDFGEGYYSMNNTQYLPNGSYLITVRNTMNCTQSIPVVIDVECSDTLVMPCIVDRDVSGLQFDASQVSNYKVQSSTVLTLKDVEFDQGVSTVFTGKDRITINESFTSNPGAKLRLMTDDCDQVACDFGEDCDDNDPCTFNDQLYYNSMSGQCVCAGTKLNNLPTIPFFGQLTYNIIQSTLSKPVEVNVEEANGLACNGRLSATVNAVNGADYYWNDGNGNFITDELIIENICANETYCFISEPACGFNPTQQCFTMPCKGSFYFDPRIFDPNPIIWDLSERENKSIASNSPNNCIRNDDEIGIELHNFEGGQPPYTLILSNGMQQTWEPDNGPIISSYESGPVFTGLTFGDYTLTITDANGCSQVIEDFLLLDDLHAIRVNQINNACPGFDNGSVSFNIINPSRERAYLYLDGSDTEGIYIGRDDEFEYVIDGLVGDKEYSFVFNVGGCDITKEVKLDRGQYDYVFNEHKDGICYFDEYCGDVLVSEKSFMNRVVCDDNDGVDEAGFGSRAFGWFFNRVPFFPRAKCSLQDCYCIPPDSDLPFPPEVPYHYNSVGDVKVNYESKFAFEIRVKLAQFGEDVAPGFFINVDIAIFHLRNSPDCEKVYYCPLSYNFQSSNSFSVFAQENAQFLDESDGCLTYRCGPEVESFCVCDNDEGIEQEDCEIECLPISTNFYDFLINHDEYKSNLEEYKSSDVAKEVEEFLKNDTYQLYMPDLQCVNITYCSGKYELISFSPIGTQFFCNDRCVNSNSSPDCDDVVVVDMDSQSDGVELDCEDEKDNDKDGFYDCEDLDCYYISQRLKSSSKKSGDISCINTTNEEDCFLMDKQDFFNKVGINSLEEALAFKEKSELLKNDEFFACNDGDIRYNHYGYSGVLYCEGGLWVYMRQDSRDAGEFNYFIYDFNGGCQSWLTHTPEISPDKLHFIEALYEVFTDGELIHITLETAGLIPAIGIIPDGINFIYYSIEGDVGGASWSMLAIVPGSQVTNGARTVAKFVRYSGGKSIVSWTVVQGVIKFGSRGQEEARNALRALMKLKDGLKAAHHMIPWKHRVEELVQQAAKYEKNRFHINDPDNGFALLKTIHKDGHDVYNILIGSVLRKVAARAKSELGLSVGAEIPPAVASRLCEAMMGVLRKKLSALPDNATLRDITLTADEILKAAGII